MTQSANVHPGVHEGRQQLPRRSFSKIKEVHEYSGRIQGYGNQYQQVGQFVDGWSDLVEGFGDKAEEVVGTCDGLMGERGIAAMSSKWDELTATGVNAPSREMRFYHRSPVTVTVYTARQGKDLYVSERVFIQGEINKMKLVIIGIACLLLACMLSFETNVTFTGTETHFNFGTFLWASVAVMVGVAVALSAWGASRRGDYLAFVRKPIHEHHYDDISSLAKGVHNSLIAAADIVGIDTTKLEPREPIFKRRRKPRL
jgi:hypothetical protein